MNEECLICKASLEYLDTDVIMECEICHKKEYSKTRCVNGHFVCDECHSSGMDEILSICLDEESVNPVEILEKMMSLPACHMHGPEHHVMVGSALLTAYKNAGGDIDLKPALIEMQKRGKQVPGGACGFWGACGAGISTGIYMSIILKATPLSKEAWGLSNQMTAKALEAIGKNGGPRCCKRDAYLAVAEAVRFTEEKSGIKMELNPITCTRSHMNNQCIQRECPFNRNSEFEKYKDEAKERWSDTDAYKEHSEKTKGYSRNKWQSLGEGIDNILEQFAVCMKRGTLSDSDDAQSLVKNLQNHITENYYTCTKEILADLGQMYTLDERFKNNIDKHGDGTAEFISKSIEIYCK